LLTADLARVRRQGGQLRLVELSEKARQRAEQIAATLLEIVQGHVGRTRAEFDQACAGIQLSPSERKLAAGLTKLVEDRCSFDVLASPDPRTLRSEVFLAASGAVRALSEGERFDREAFVCAQALARALTPEAFERALYADLYGEQVLQHIDDITAPQLVEKYREAQVQAVLLRAVKVTAHVNSADAYTYRSLFRKLKFLRLLYAIAPLDDGGYQIEIDGPFSLFSSVTKYGLQLALALPALQACDQWKITAQVLWGKERESFLFTRQGRVIDKSPLRQPPLPDEVEALLARFQALNTRWRAEAANDILELNGMGLCVPDLRFTHRDTGEIAYLEVMGYWSRDAVWKRVDLVRQGLPFRVLFAASSRLRVSEEVLNGEYPSQIYIYRGSMSAREIARRLGE
jgi:predicted nuclease of restriction endonuclease-like RecB superfamily